MVFKLIYINFICFLIYNLLNNYIKLIIINNKFLNYKFLELFLLYIILILILNYIYLNLNN